MKVMLIIALAVLALAGCAGRERGGMTDKEASAIVQALKRSQ